MKTYYLIDFENTHRSGFVGSGQLGKKDRIVVFFTPNVPIIDMRILLNCGKASIKMLEVPAGDQSADVHIDSYIGWLVGKSKAKCNIVVVSKDHGYDKICAFWNTRRKTNVIRTPDIASGIARLTGKKPEKAQSTPEKNSKTEEIAQKVPASSTPAAIAVKTPKAAPVLCGEEKTKKNVEIMKLVGKAGFDVGVVGFTASTVLKYYGKENGKEETRQALLEKFGQDTGGKLYELVKCA